MKGDCRSLRGLDSKQLTKKIATDSMIDCNDFLMPVETKEDAAKGHAYITMYGARIIASALVSEVFNKEDTRHLSLEMKIEMGMIKVSDIVLIIRDSLKEYITEISKIDLDSIESRQLRD